MAAIDAGTASEPPKESALKGLVIGAGLALVLGGGGFAATWSGIVLGGTADPKAEPAEVAAQAPVEPIGDVTFAPIDPIVVSLGPDAGAAHLRFRAQLETRQGHVAEVTRLMPRVVDALNAYLRAVDPAELQDPTAMTRLRGQMLRRVQSATGEGRVSDLLVMEFVLS